jgi:tetratricopeptide (TPR) repeat protein
MPSSVLRVSRVAAIISAALLVLLILVLFAIRLQITATDDANLRWLVLPVFAVYTLAGGAVWVIGCVFSLRARRVEGKKASRTLWLNQSYVLFWVLLFGWWAIDQTLAGGRAIRELEEARTDQDRFDSLGAAAKSSFDRGKRGRAQAYASELLNLMPRFNGDSNYGNAVFDANLVLGRIAAHEGRLDEAKKYLLAAGQTPGSPELNSFGPNMSLARDLLLKGEREVALQYFDLCRKFWLVDDGKLDEWAKDVRAGKIPDFGANLDY